jgi:hypothetical protein
MNNNRQQHPKKRFFGRATHTLSIFFLCFVFVVMAVTRILRGLKEFGEPTQKALIMDLSPANCRAGMLGLYYLIRDMVVVFAALDSALIW